MKSVLVDVARKHGRSATLASAILALSVPGSAAAATITGTVFEDFNADGVKSTTPVADVGVAGVTVAAFDAVSAGAPVATATSIANGSYSLAGLRSGLTYRVEFTIPAGSTYVASRHPQAPPVPAGAAVNGTSVQFRQPGEDASFAVLQPADYCQNNPNLLLQCYVSAQKGAAITTDYLTAAALKVFPITSTGDTYKPPLAPSGAPPVPLEIATFAQTGAVWGLAYARQSKSIYAGAYTKRQTTFGPGGAGAIYRIDSSGAVSTLIDLNVFVAPLAGGTTAALHQASPIVAPYADAPAYAQVGKSGLGDVDVSADGTTVFAVGLNSKKLYEVPVTQATGLRSAAAPTSVLVPDPADCAAGNHRPFGLGQKETKVYLGMVCDGPTDADVRAYVYEYDPATNAFGAQVLNADLTTAAIDADRTATFKWGAWDDAQAILFAHPQPMLSDIAFDDAGRMILGFRDRYADQQGGPHGPKVDGSAGVTVAGEGDIMTACHDAPNGKWILETDGSCETTAGEFFAGDSNPVGGERETGMGGLALVPGRGEVSSTVLDPVNCYSAGVSAWATATSGLPIRAYETTDDTLENVCGQALANNSFYKANGLGDLEVMCDEAPLEVGSHVWFDANFDGIQDPGETPIGNVTVNLLNSGGAVVATTQTTSDGSYFLPIAAGTSYTVAVPLVQPAGSTSIAQFLPTLANQAHSDARDSDGTVSGSLVVASVGPRQTGESDHTSAFGFVQRANVKVAKSGPPVAQPGERITYFVTVTNDGPGASFNTTVTDALPAGLALDPASLKINTVAAGQACTTAGGSLSCSIGTMSAPSIGSPTVATVSYEATVPVAGVKAQYVNTAIVSTSTPGDNPNDNGSTHTLTIPAADVVVEKRSTPVTQAGGQVDLDADRQELRPQHGRGCHGTRRTASRIDRDQCDRRAGAGTRLRHLDRRAGGRLRPRQHARERDAPDHGDRQGGC